MSSFKYQRRPGDLSIVTARVGMSVRCIRKPDYSLWNLEKSFQSLVLPEPGTIYVIRAILLRGVYLRDVVNPSFNLPQLQGEPEFPFVLFNIIQTK